MPTPILLVDDDPVMHKLLGYHLERAGYKVMEAKNGRDALHLASQLRPGVIVMDIMMADMDGLTALRELKKHDITKGIPVVVMTANPHYASRVEAEKAGAASFLTKPFSPAQIVVEVQKLLPGDPPAGDPKKA